MTAVKSTQNITVIRNKEIIEVCIAKPSVTNRKNQGTSKIVCTIIFRHELQLQRKCSGVSHESYTSFMVTTIAVQGAFNI